MCPLIICVWYNKGPSITEDEIITFPEKYLSGVLFSMDVRAGHLKVHSTTY